MQRILSLATLAVLGGLAWLFLREGGLNNVAMDPTGGKSPAVDLNEMFQSDSNPSGGAISASGDSPSIRPASAATPGATIRIASFNIEVLGEEKAGNAAIVRTLAEIVRKFHVVAIQGIRTQDDFLIPNFMRQVNSTGRKYNYLVGPRIGNTAPMGQYAFIFDENRVECDFNTSYTIRDPENLLHREPLVASFRAKGATADRAFTFTLINVHTDPHFVAEELDVLAEAYRIVRLAGRNEDDVIMLGDFHADDRRLGRLGQIPGAAPLLRETPTDTRRTALYDNIVIHQPSTTEYVGRSGAYDFMREFNLTQENALSVSDHLPIWAEFSIYELDSAGRIASRNTAHR